MEREYIELVIKEGDREVIQRFYNHLGKQPWTKDQRTGGVRDGAKHEKGLHPDK